VAARRPPVVRPFLACAQASGSATIVRRPVQCLVRGPSKAQSVNLDELRWRSWGSPQAKGRGVDIGTQQPGTNVPVTVTLWRIRRCGGVRYYTRVQTVSAQGASTVPLPACPRF
jgi:hypothetical protein